MRVGIFGGTFDPVHLGHLILAEQCRDQAGLDQVLFIPSARPPHKQGQTLTPFEKRVEMLALAVSGQPAFRIDEMEKDRPGPSYTVDTLRLLQERLDDPELFNRRAEPRERSESGSARQAAELFLILGSDSLIDLPTWYDPCGIVKLATLLIVARPGWNAPSLDTLQQALGGDVPVRMQVVDCPLIDISSRDLRQRVAAGRSVRYLVPRAVEAYIDEKRLWQ